MSAVSSELGSGEARLQGRSRLLGISAAVLCLAIILAGAEWAVWSSLMAPRQADLVEIRPDFRVRMAAGLAARPNIDRIREGANGRLIATAGKLRMAGVKPAKANQWNLNVTYGPDLLSAEQSTTLAAGFRLAHDPAYAKSLNLNPDQVKKLDAIPSTLGVALTDVERASFQKLWDQYATDKDKAAAQAAILKQLADTDAAHAAAVRADVDARVAQIKSILTPEQLAAFKAASR